MSMLEIMKDGSPVLKKVAKRVRRVDDNTRQLALDMCETMVEARGVGLAANQVGVPKRIIAVLFEDGPRIFVNPQVTAWSGETECRDEGCLSFPNIFGEVSRDVRVEIQAQDLDLNKHTFTMEGFGARVFQHEIDHLNGITFVTRADPKTLREINPEDFEECEEGDEEYEDGEEEDSIVAIDETTENTAD